NGANKETRSAIVEALGAVGPDAAKEAVPVLMGLLREKEVAFLAQVLDALAAMRQEAVKAVPDIVGLLEHKDHSVRANAAFALSNIGPEAAKDALEPIKKALTDPDVNVRLYSAQAVINVGGLGQTKLAVPVLLGCLEDESAGVRAAAAVNLGEL